MDNQKLGELLLQKEKLEKEIEEIRERLNKLGEILISLGESIQDNPEEVIFHGVPKELEIVSSYPIQPGISFNWNDLPEKETIPKLIKKIRSNTEALERIEDKLLEP